MASSSAPLPPGVSIPALPAFDDTLGAALLGCIFTAMFYGVTCVQAFIYWQSPVEAAGDNLRRVQRIRWTVAVLWILDTLHTGLIVYSIYWYLIKNFANPLAVGEVRWSITAEIFVTPCSDTIVRLFFAWRIWVLSGRNKLLTLPVVVLTLVILALGLWFPIRAFHMTEFTEFEQISWLLYTGLSLLVVGDAYTAIVLCFLLRRSRTGFAKTDTVVNLLMAYTIETGALTSVVSMACLIAFATLPMTYVFLALHFNLSKLYLNAMLATLNARNFIRSQVRAASAPSVSVQSDNMNMGRVREASAGIIRIETVVERDYQEDDFVVEHPYSGKFAPSRVGMYRDDAKGNWA